MFILLIQWMIRYNIYDSECLKFFTRSSLLSYVIIALLLAELSTFKN